jgi:hypothetical protein
LRPALGGGLAALDPVWSLAGKVNSFDSHRAYRGQEAVAPSLAQFGQVTGAGDAENSA